jgi:hypothetical protein
MSDQYCEFARPASITSSEELDSGMSTPDEWELLAIFSQIAQAVFVAPVEVRNLAKFGVDAKQSRLMVTALSCDGVE